MADKPILFSAPMVLALLEGRKTQTRRIINPQPTAPGEVMVGDRSISAAEWQIRYERRIKINIGDRLYVRETFSGDWQFTGLPPVEWGKNGPIWYWADGNPECGDWTKPKPGIHMPRWASRITLLVDDVRVERLQSISEDDADAEGFGGDFPHTVMPEIFLDADATGQLSIPQCYGRLWDHINGPGAWAANPWVVAYTFRVVLENIDKIERAAA